MAVPLLFPYLDKYNLCIFNLLFTFFFRFVIIIITIYPAVTLNDAGFTIVSPVPKDISSIFLTAPNLYDDS